jgi:dihydroorotate dehydrogenase
MLGFSFMEVGSVTAMKWGGNEQPRLFRVPEDKALINRMGLNNDGAEAIGVRLRRVKPNVHIPLLVNVAKTPAPDLEGEKAVADYVSSILTVRDVADAIVLNISCPNSGDGRTFEDPELLGALLAGATGALADGPPLLIKISPDLDEAAFDTVVQLSIEAGINGFVAANTSTNRSVLRTSGATLDSIGNGGMSGAPLLTGTVQRISELRKRVGGEALIIGVGGVFTSDDANRVLAAGADLVEGYTGFVYEGPGYAGRINRGVERSV